MGSDRNVLFSLTMFGLAQTSTPRARLRSGGIRASHCRSPQYRGALRIGIESNAKASMVNHTIAECRHATRHSCILCGRSSIVV